MAPPTPSPKSTSRKSRAPRRHGMMTQRKRAFFLHQRDRQFPDLADAARANPRARSSAGLVKTARGPQPRPRCRALTEHAPGDRLQEAGGPRLAELLHPGCRRPASGSVTCHCDLRPSNTSASGARLVVAHAELHARGSGAPSAFRRTSASGPAGLRGLRGWLEKGPGRAALLFQHAERNELVHDLARGRLAHAERLCQFRPRGGSELLQDGRAAPADSGGPWSRIMAVDSKQGERPC
jgi:hypothetical protein